MLAEITNRLRYVGDLGYDALSKLPHKRLLKLKHEMNSLYETEKKRRGLFSSYLQTLIELNIAQKLYEIETLQTKVETDKPVEGTTYF